MAALARGEEIELRVDRLAYGGRGVARHGELVVFVARGLPGDRVRARVTKFKRRYAEAQAIELLEPGPGRVEARCAHFEDAQVTPSMRRRSLLGITMPKPLSGCGTSRRR